ncbi:hypothetical protein [Microbacterium sp. JZ31]|uniref:hypothetical protein n=1 Tax=Microbacterium sp. JZ31 TaxID=1906274 RepID=UPI001934880D|nr:hypothetical protein [Microbacterium sp. JZ31]
MPARKYTADVAPLDREVIVRECGAVIAHARDADSAAIGVAIHLEDALGIVLPEPAIHPAHLGTTDRIRRTLAALEEDR